jgi:endonuclease/exonuclease/phosphatase family metal-dependent hydrolase
MTGNKNKLPFFDRLILWLNYLLCAALLIGYLAPVVDPRSVWIIAFFGLAYPPILLANVILILYWFLRRSKWALLSIVVIAIGYKVLNNNIGLRMPPSVSYASNPNQLRIMTYNVHDFKKYGSANDVSTKHEILEIIDHQQPDIIGIEEFFSRKRGQYAMVDSIKKILKSEQAYFKPFMANNTEGIGMAIFSKYPIITTGIIWLNEPNNLNQCLFVDVKKNDRIFRMYAVHLQSIRFDPEDYKILDDVSKKGKTDVSGSKRIGAKLKRAFLKRAEQVALIKAHMAQCPYPYFVAGDFNDTPSSYAVNQMAKGLKNAFCEKGSGLGRTYNGSFPNYQIDYIMTSKQFDIRSYGVIRKKLSDHYPVYSDVVLTPAAVN